MEPDHPILTRCRDILSSLYGERLRGLILYGSAARGADTAESDIDILVLLDGPVNVAREVRRIWDVLYPAQLACDRVISVLAADAESYQRGDYNLYRNVQREGIAI